MEDKVIMFSFTEPGQVQVGRKKYKVRRALDG